MLQGAPCRSLPCPPRQLISCARGLRRFGRRSAYLILPPGRKYQTAFSTDLAPQRNNTFPKGKWMVWVVRSILTLHLSSIFAFGTENVTA